jgi:hypothetical protein
MVFDFFLLALDVAGVSVGLLVHVFEEVLQFYVLLFL